MAFSVASSYAKLRAVVDNTTNDALPPPSSIARGIESLPSGLSEDGLGEEATEAHLRSDICPGLNGQKTSSNYYGFVTGGVFPIAEVADNIVTAFDQNVQVHLPDQSISTIVEDKALSMLLELVGLDQEWKGRTFTTGATAANILGLACGREMILKSRLEAAGESRGVGELGLLAACAKAGIKEIQILTTMAHSSLYKAASIVGIGRASVKDIPLSATEPWKMNLEVLQQELKREKDGIVTIVALSAGEVNTGHFATTASEMQAIRYLCTTHNAWLHIDAAFALFAASLPHTPEFSSLVSKTSSLHLADSITGDAHKLLNVPYDAGIFFTRSPTVLSAVFQNPNAAYLASGPSSIPSPLNIGIENSRRFRALPVYAVLLAYGRSGLAEIFAKQVRLARAIADYINENPAYELLAQTNNVGGNEKGNFSDIHIILLFRAISSQLNADLVRKINSTRKMYVSGTQWQGRPACRVAVSTWRVDVERDLGVVKGILEGVVRS